MVGGRVGSGITAELGSMTVTEQVDALRAMAISPIRRLVVPRVIATVMMMPVLTAIADLLGILGGLAIAVLELQHDRRRTTSRASGSSSRSRTS